MFKPCTFFHALQTSFEWVVRAKPACQKAEPELQVGNGTAAHRCDGSSFFSAAHAKRVVAQQGALAQLFGQTKNAAGALCEFR